MWSAKAGSISLLLHSALAIHEVKAPEIQMYSIFILNLFLNLNADHLEQSYGPKVRITHLDNIY